MKSVNAGKNAKSIQIQQIKILLYLSKEKVDLRYMFSSFLVFVVVCYLYI